MPTSSDAACRLIVRPAISRTSPNGITANAAMAGTTAITGASVCSRRSAPAGRTSSLRRNFTGSATRVLMIPWPAKPKMAARLAPMRSWMMALTLRSKKTPMAITWSAMRSITTALAHAMATSIPIVTPGRAPPRRVQRSVGGEALEERLERGDVEALVIGRVAHLHHRRRPTARQALDLLERETAVGGPLLRADAETALDDRAELLRAAQRSRQVDAELEMVPPLRLGPEHRVERDHGRHPRERDLHQLGDVLLHRQREPAELSLRQPERREQRRAALGVAPENLAVLRERGFGEPRLGGISGHIHPRSC